MKHIVEPIRNKDDVLRISNALKPLYRLIWIIGVNTGLRISDIVNLKIDIVEKEYIDIIEQKTHKRKKFPLQKKLQYLIKEYESQIRSKQKVNKEFKDYLFISRKRQVVTSVSVYREIINVCKLLDIKGNFGTHTMRKTFGYHHYKQYNNIALLQKIFNHSSPAITLRYIGITQDDIDESYLNFKIGKTKNIREENNKYLEEEIQSNEEFKKEIISIINEKFDNLIKVLKPIKLAKLTKAENSLVQIMVENRIFNTRKLADKLCVSLSTISTHLDHIYTKCDFEDNNMAAIVDYYYSNRKG